MLLHFSIIALINNNNEYVEKLINRAFLKSILNKLIKGFVFFIANRKFSLESIQTFKKIRQISLHIYKNV